MNEVLPDLIRPAKAADTGVPGRPCSDLSRVETAPGRRHRADDIRAAVISRGLAGPLEPLLSTPGILKSVPLTSFSATTMAKV